MVRFVWKYPLLLLLIRRHTRLYLTIVRSGEAKRGER